MSAERKKLARFTAIFAGGTLFSRVLGLGRDAVLAKYIPTPVLDLFFTAFMFPNMLRDMLGEGATNAAFVPVFTECRTQEGEAAYQRLAASVMGVMLVLFAVLSVAGVLLLGFLPKGMELLQPFLGEGAKGSAILGDEYAHVVLVARCIFPYFFFIGMAAFAMAPLFVARRYAVPAWSPALLNVSLIVCCLLFHERFGNPVWALVLGVWLGGGGQLALLWYAMRRYTGIGRPRFRFRQPGMLKIFFLLGPVILGQSAGEINKVVNMLFAYSLEGGVSALFYANRLVQLPLSIFGMAMAVAVLPAISEAAARKDDAEIHATLLQGLRQSFFLAAPAMAGLLVLGKPIIRLLFERGEFGPGNTDATADALFYYSLGLLAFVWIKVSVQGFYGVQNTKAPVIVASACMLLNILLNFLLVKSMAHRGLALSTSIAFGCNFLLLYGLLCRRFGLLWNQDTGVMCIKVVASLLVMSCVAYGVHAGADHWLGHEGNLRRLAAVGLSIGAGALVYGVAAKLTHLKEFDAFAGVARRRS
jgi:putative peptidoglycan lipid II flippase